MPNTLDRKRLLILCWIGILAVLSATLWPYDLFPPNRVSWLSAVSGIRFGRSGVVVTDGPLRMGGDGSGSACSLEILLRPANVESRQTILGFFAAHSPRPFLVRQAGRNLYLSHGFEEFAGVDDFFRDGQLVFLTVTSGPMGTVIYKDGRPAGTFPQFRISQNDLAGEMAIGNGPSYVEPWEGEVRGLAIYSRELPPDEAFRDDESWVAGDGLSSSVGAVARYTFGEARGNYIHNAVVLEPSLEIPRWFEVPGKGFLNSPVEEFEAGWTYFVFHFLENIVGFIPPGFLLCAYLATTRSRPRAILYTTLALGALSLAIEVVQFYIPQRDSDITDIITNTLGALLGAVLARPKIVASILSATKLNSL